MLLRKASMLTALILGVFLMIPEEIVDAGRGGRSSGGRSFSSGRSSSSRSTRSTRSPSRSTRSSNSRTKNSRSNTSKSWGSSKSKATSSRKMTKADKALAAKAKKNGTSFKSKKEAQAAFKKKNATKYTSKYKTKPATRPSHIPQTTTVGGTSYNVTYNQGMGGYGYMGPSGAWIAYNAMADAAMMSMLMRQQGYYAPGMNTGAVVVHNPSGLGFVWLLISIIGGVVVIAVFVSILRS